MPPIHFGDIFKFPEKLPSRELVRDSIPAVRHGHVEINAAKRTVTVPAPDNVTFARTLIEAGDVDASDVLFTSFNQQTEGSVLDLFG